MMKKLLPPPRVRRVLALAALLVLAMGACADEGGELFGDEDTAPRFEDETTFDEEEVFGDPSSFEGQEVVIRGAVAEVLDPGLLLLERGDEDLLVAAPEDGELAVEEGDVVHVQGVVRPFELGDVEVGSADAAHDALVGYDRAAMIEAEVVFRLDDDALE